MMKYISCYAAIVAFGAAAAPAAAQSLAYDAIELPNLAEPAPCFAEDLNDSGVIVGMAQISPFADTFRPWMWDVKNGMVNLFPTAGLTWFASATEINNAGEVLGMYADPCFEPNPHPECPIGFIPFGGVTRAVLWSTDGSGNFTELPSPAADLDLDNMGVAPGAISNTGLVGASAGLREPGEFSFGYSIGMLWDQTGDPVLLDDVIPGFTIVNISQFNDAGQYCGVGSINGTQQARGFFFDPETGYTVLPRLTDESAGIEQANAIALNNKGQVIGNATVLSIQGEVVVPMPAGAFVWHQDSGMTNLGMYDVSDINDNGHIVGTLQNPPGENFPHAVLHDGNEWHIIQEHTKAVNPANWRLAYAQRINNAGQIIVNAIALTAEQIIESGEVQPFLLTPLDTAQPGDLDGDGSVGVRDLLLLLAAWGECADCEDCDADLDDNCTVNVSDLLALLANWG